MSLFELFGKNNKKNIGTIEKDNHNETARPIAKILFRFIISVIIIITIEVLIISFADKFFFFINMVLLFYLIISYLYKIKPNIRDMGVAGFIDHPTKITDDINRFLFVLMIIIAPGKFLSKSIVVFVKLFI